MYDDPDDEIWARIQFFGDQDQGEANDFIAISLPDEVNSAKPLYILVHPGDVVQSKDDASNSDDPRQIPEYSWACQIAQAEEVDKLLKAGWDLAVLHRFSSTYAFGVSNSAEELVSAIDTIHEDGASLYGDDLDAAAKFLCERMTAAKRPAVLLSGAWSAADGGCITALGQALEAAGTRVHLSYSACISPDGSEDEWRPIAGRLPSIQIPPASSQPAQASSDLRRLLGA
ncbi:hypothetical protein [Microvirga tunisiensis]|uniref:hypothetical protein n=1 Tax=Microvirga tunisiensis TaxID=2108360 RepID=UPI0018656DFF|nr:hypothetical protein [Microvirga tunisiensis]